MRRAVRKLLDQAADRGIPEAQLKAAREEQDHPAPSLRPEGLVIALRREAERVAHDLRPASSPAPIDLRARKPAADPWEAAQRATDMLYEASGGRLFDGTVETLQRFLTTFEARILEEARRQGRPLPQDLVRRALLELYMYGQRKRGKEV